LIGLHAISGGAGLLYAVGEVIAAVKQNVGINWHYRCTII